MDKSGRLDASADCHTRVLELNPRHAAAHNYLGVIHARQGLIDSAMQSFAEAVAIDPSYEDAMHNLDRACRMRRPEFTGDSGQ